MARILIVDDERVVRNGLSTLLSGEGYEVVTAKDGDEAIEKANAERPDLVLLDVMMPRLNGFKTCTALRANDPSLPILFLTAKNSEGDQVRAFGLGADDYLDKAVSEPLLLARIARALERKHDLCAGNPQALRSSRMPLGTGFVDWRELQLMDGDRVMDCLTPTEANLLTILIRQTGHSLSPDEIIAELRGEGFACEDELVYSHISRLRHKLEPLGVKIENRAGVGYRLV